MKNRTLAALLACGCLLSPLAPAQTPAAPATASTATDDPVALQKSAQAAIAAKDWAEALGLWDRYLAQKPDDTTGHRSRGWSLLELGRGDEAIAAYQKAVELAPQDAKGWNELCWTHIVLNQTTVARPYCDKSVALDQNNYAAFLNLGHTFLLQGDASAAQAWYQKSLTNIDSEADLKDGPLADFDLFINKGWQVDASRKAKAWFEIEGAIWLSRLAPVIRLIADVNIARDKSDDARAITLLEDLLKLLIDLRGEDHPQVAKVRNALPGYINSRANQLFSEGRYADALPLYRQVLTAREATGSPEAITNSLLNLGTTWQMMGKYTEAEPLFAQALALTEKTKGPDHVAVVEVLNKYVKLLAANPKQSPVVQEPYLRRILAIREKNLGADHPGIVNSLTNLATFLHSRAPDEAVTLRRRIISIIEREFGASHSKVALADFWLAASLREMKRYDEAEELYLHALSIHEKNSKADHPDVLSERSMMGLILFNLSQMLEGRKQHEKADEYFSRVLSLLKETFTGAPITAEKPPSVLLEKFGWAQREADLLEFRPLFGIQGNESSIRKSLAIRKAVFGENHPIAVESESVLAKTLFLSGNFKEPETILRRVIALRSSQTDSDQMALSRDLNYLGQIKLRLTELIEAEALFRHALQINQKIQNQQGISTDFLMLGQVLISQGRFNEAEILLERALAIIKNIIIAKEKEIAIETADEKDHPVFGKILSGISRSRFKSSVVVLETAIENALALSQITGGNISKAIKGLEDYISQSKTPQSNDSTRFAQTYSFLGTAYHFAGDQETAEKYARRVITLLESSREISSADKASLTAQVAILLPKEEMIPLLRASAATLETTAAGGIESTSIMIALGALLPPEDGEPILKRALAALENQSEYLSAQAEALLGQQMMSNPDSSTEAESHLLRAEQILSRTGNSNPMLVWTRFFLAMHFAMNERNDLAIFYGKQAVNGMQQLRSLNAGMSKELQGKFAGKHGDVYKLVSDLLLEEGRIPEAQQILAMLKEDELHGFIQRSAADDPRKTKAGFDGREQTWANRYEQISGQLAAMAKEYDALQKQEETSLSPEDKARLSKLDADLTVARQAYDAFMVDLKREFTQDSVPGRDKAARSEEYGSKNLASLGALQGTLETLGHGAVTLHYLMTDKRLWILLTTPTIQLKREAAISEKDLNRQIGDYREAIANRDPKIKELGKALYDILIAPVAKDLAQEKAQTLMLSLDGSLRYLPMAALFDGEQYLAQRYRLALFTEAAKDKLSTPPKAQWRFAGFGLTEKIENFDALPSVKGELEGMAGPGFAGDIKFDKDFTAASFKSALARRPPVVHLASHFVFKSGTEADSFLLLGDGTPLSLKAIKEGNFKFTDVDLVTLSACETAVGGGNDANGREIEGFGALAQNQGAKGVIATLWPVADQSTGQFMQLFYGFRQKHPGTTKAEAMQMAQRAFIEGRVGPALAEVSRGAKRADGAKTVAPVNTTDHPFFWAPFILMGNWL